MTRIPCGRHALLATFVVASLLAAPPAPAVADPDAGTLLLRFAFGTGENEVGGAKLDPHGVSEGFPPAFAEAADGRLLLLDVVNARVLRCDPASGTAEVIHRIAANGPVPDAVYDLAPTADGGFWLASRGRKELRRVDARGAVTAVVEGVHPQAIAVAGGFLFAADLRTGGVFRFAGNGTTTGLVEGGGQGAPVSRTGEELYVATVARDAGVLHRHAIDSGERVEVFRVAPPEPGQYVQSFAPLGFDRDGRLYAEACFARDLDPAHVTHEYRLFLLRIDPDTGRELARVEGAPFRKVDSLLAPRLHVVRADGSLLTWEVEGGGFSLRRIAFPGGRP